MVRQILARFPDYTDEHLEYVATILGVQPKDIIRMAARYEVLGLVGRSKRTTKKRKDIPIPEGFEEFKDRCLDLFNARGCRKLHPDADFRKAKVDANIQKARAFFEEVFAFCPEMHEAHLCFLDEIAGPNLHAIRNFILFRYRRLHKGRDPPFAATDNPKRKRASSKPPRVPKNPDKGLGCSKCRYGPTGCKGCGWLPHELEGPAAESNVAPLLDALQGAEGMATASAPASTAAPTARDPVLPSPVKGVAEVDAMGAMGALGGDANGGAGEAGEARGKSSDTESLIEELVFD